MFAESLFFPFIYGIDDDRREKDGSIDPRLFVRPTPSFIFFQQIHILAVAAMATPSPVNLPTKHEERLCRPIRG